MSSELILLLMGLWLGTGALAWRYEIKRNGWVFGAFDAIMVGPCMLIGPLAWALVLIRR